MLTLVWIVEITHTLVSMFGSSDIEFQRTLVMISAAVLILALNIAIQPVQLGMRVLMIENVPKHQQGTVSACTSYVTGIGSILGLVAGATELSKWLPCFQGTQFQGLTLIASFALTISVMVTCLAAKEENPRILPSTVSPISFSRVLRGLIRTYMTMSNNIKKVCQIQYWAWMGWFPFLYYATTYVGDLYTMNTLANYPSMKLQDRRGLHDESARVGSFAYLLFSCNTLVTNIMLSIVLSRISETSFARVWTSAHLVFAICMFLTLFVTRWTGGMVIVTLAGISWAVTLWVPYAIIGLELAAQADDDHDEDQKGSIVSLHNVALSAPQILAALLGSAIFWIYQQMGSNDGVGWALRAGGCIVLVATYLASRLDT
ncbi:hypothetical protein MMC19_003860 [Ptychographa xylographoides]|nr:hypothetical protein [Ptychographa xylographoides]